ncbi:unnamed protein product [Protopolystoma xenopodis]|uniref:Uncharacterized protein n=1 Tax=Protopolystoma xenopodis TaxID=117903 RepID=A0A3S5AM02_9PLAT|nr:unnamed protein product [Protopolystoma xenopodis]
MTLARLSAQQGTGRDVACARDRLRGRCPISVTSFDTVSVVRLCWRGYNLQLLTGWPLPCLASSGKHTICLMTMGAVILFDLATRLRTDEEAGSSRSSKRGEEDISSEFDDAELNRFSALTRQLVSPTESPKARQGDHILYPLSVFGGGE